MQLKNYKKLSIYYLHQIKGGFADIRQEAFLDGGGGVVHDKPDRA